jgi:hypothetical protein
MAAALLVNQLSAAQIDEAWFFLLGNTFGGEPYISEGNRGYKCNLVFTIDRAGNPKYPQFDLSRFGWPGIKFKVLVHHLYWRFENAHAVIPVGVQISHLDQNKKYIHGVAETPAMNESRKYCHLFRWFDIQQLPGGGFEDNPRCPHWEAPCTGPFK